MHARYNKTIDPNCVLCKEYIETVLVSMYSLGGGGCIHFINCNILQIKFEHLFGFHERNTDLNKKIGYSSTYLAIFGNFHSQLKIFFITTFPPVTIKQFLLLIISVNNKAMNKHESCLSLNSSIYRNAIYRNTWSICCILHIIHWKKNPFEVFLLPTKTVTFWMTFFQFWGIFRNVQVMKLRFSSLWTLLSHLSSMSPPSLVGCGWGLDTWSMIARVRSAADARAAEPPTQERHSQALLRRCSAALLRRFKPACAPRRSSPHFPPHVHGSSWKAAPSLRTRPPAGCQPEPGLRTQRGRREVSVKERRRVINWTGLTSCAAAASSTASWVSLQLGHWVSFWLPVELFFFFLSFFVGSEWWMDFYLIYPLVACASGKRAQLLSCQHHPSFNEQSSSQSSLAPQRCWKTALVWSPDV